MLFADERCKNLRYLVASVAKVRFQKPKLFNGPLQTREVFIMSTKRITMIAMFAAISVALNMLTIITGVKYFAISFTYIPAFVAGAFMGPVSGFLVAFLGDLIAGFIRPLGPYNPIIGIASGLLGLIPGVVFKLLKTNDYVKLALSALLCLVICTAGLNTLALYLMFGAGKTYWGYLSVRLPFQLAVLAINLAAMIIIWKPLRMVERKFSFK